jgi:hypothetical protein
MRFSVHLTTFTRSSFIARWVTQSGLGLRLVGIPLRVGSRVGVQHDICMYINKPWDVFFLNVNERRQDFQPGNSSPMSLQVVNTYSAIRRKI